LEIKKVKQLSKEEIDAVVRRFRFENLDMATREATHWFRDALSEVGTVYREPLFKQVISPRQMTSGSMYFFGYNPKGKTDLSFYDSFPLIVGLEWNKGYVLGLNLHYLRHYNRAVFLNYLLDYTNIEDWYKTPGAFMKMTYDKLKSSTSMMTKFMRASIKRYNYEQIVGTVKYVVPSDWKIVPFLPIDRFVGATREDVFKWSAKQ
jgi:hypothetical protein